MARMSRVPLLIFLSDQLWKQQSKLEAASPVLYVLNLMLGSVKASGDARRCRTPVKMRGGMRSLVSQAIFLTIWPELAGPSFCKED